MRLSVNSNGELAFSKNRLVSEEWYVSMEDVSLNATTQQSPSLITPIAKKRMCFRSVKSGVYLVANEDGTAGTSSDPCPGTRWLMMPSSRADSLLESPTPSPRIRQQRSLYDEDRVIAEVPSLPLRARSRTSSSGSVNLNLQRSSSQTSTSPRTPTANRHNQMVHCGLFILGSEAYDCRPLRCNAKGHFETAPAGSSPERSSAFKDEFDEALDNVGSIKGCNDDNNIWWEIEFTSGELCFISNPIIDQRLRCNVIGQLSLSQAWKGWEVFRFIEASSLLPALDPYASNGSSEGGPTRDLLISSWTHHTKFLASDPDGNVFTTENRLGHWERWRVVKAPSGDGVWIQSAAHGRVLSVQPTQRQPKNDQHTQKLNDAIQQQLNGVGQHLNGVGGKFRHFTGNLVQDINASFLQEEIPTNDQMNATRVVMDQEDRNSFNKLGDRLRLFKDSFVQNLNESFLQEEVPSNEDPKSARASTQPHEGSSGVPEADFADSLNKMERELKLGNGRKRRQQAYIQQQAHRLHTTTKINDPKCMWHLEAAHKHTYYVTSPCHGQQLASNKQGPFLTRHRKDWEEWKIERSSREGAEGCFTLFSTAHCKYLGATSNGSVHTTTQVGEWSLWEVVESDHYVGAVHIVSHAHQRQLAADDSGQLSTSYHGSGEWQSWRLEPSLPSTISGTQIAAMTTAGAVGLALTVAMPFAVVGAVEAVGLTATELAVGLTAEAVAGFSGGALLGAGVVGTTAMSVSKKQQPCYYESGNGQDSNSNLNADESHLQPVSASGEINEDTVSNSLRPLAAWRNW